jgi:hypothetical protein
MGKILTTGKNTLASEFENRTYGGNRMWADPDEARLVGGQILEQLCERYSFQDQRSDTPTMTDVTGKIFADTLSSINYAGLPTERRANILHGLIDAAASAGVLGGEPEWAPIVIRTEA